MVHRMKMLEVLAPGDRDRELALTLDPASIPAHIAIIMDGNGRWAKRRGLPRIAGHKVGVSTVRSVVEDCANLGVKALTLYAFSAENWKRPRAEVDMLWRLLRYYLRHELEDLQRNNIRLQSSGHVEALPEVAYEELMAVERATARNQGMRLNLAINYSARIDIVDAVNAVLDEARIAGRLNDLVIDRKDDFAAAFHCRPSGPGPSDPDLRRNADQQLSCCGRSPTRSSTLPIRSGRTSTVPSCCAPFSIFSAGNAASADFPAARRSILPTCRMCSRAII